MGSGVCGLTVEQAIVDFVSQRSQPIKASISYLSSDFPVLRVG